MKSEFGVGKMRRYVLDKNNNIVNVIELEDDAEWSPPDGHKLAPKSFSPPTPTAPEPEEIDDDLVHKPKDSDKTMYGGKSTDSEKIDAIAKFLGLKE